MKTAIITGAAGGICGGIAEKLSLDGWRTGLVDIDPAKLDAAAARIPNSQALIADVADEASMKAALNAFSVVPDLLVNGAGIVRFGAFVEQPLADIRKVIEVNLLGVIVPSWLVGREMAERRSGVIINIASISGLVAGRNVGAYGPTKAAIANLTQLLAVELGPLGVRANTIAPGLINAGMGAQTTYTDTERYQARGAAVPSRRQGTANDIAEAVAFLASDAASYINGQQIVIDGGLTVSLLDQLPSGKRQ